jgi:hypothetical protein
MPKIGDVLGSLIGDARYVVVVDEHGGGTVAIRLEFLYVNNGTIGYTADFGQHGPALAFQIFRGFALAAQERNRTQRDGNPAQEQRIETK